MVDNSTHPNHSSSGKGSNILATIPAPIPEVGGSSKPHLELAYDVIYEQLYEIWPITHQIAKATGLLPVTHNLLHHPKRKETTRNGVLVAPMEDLVFDTLEELKENSEELVQQDTHPPIN